MCCNCWVCGSYCLTSGTAGSRVGGMIGLSYVGPEMLGTVTLSLSGCCGMREADMVMASMVFGLDSVLGWG